jgi:hypothetical protein
MFIDMQPKHGGYEPLLGYIPTTPVPGLFKKSSTVNIHIMDSFWHQFIIGCREEAKRKETNSVKVM